MANYLQIQTQSIPNQEIATVLGGQACGIVLKELSDGKQYFSLTVNGVKMCENVLIQHNVTLVNMAYSTFVGDFIVLDTQGDLPPNYTGWGTRWVLLYNT